MPDNPERTSGNNAEAVEQARDEVRNKVKEAEKAATKEEEKRQKDKIAEDVKKEVKETVEAVDQLKRAGTPVDAATKQKIVTSLAHALEAVNQGIIDLPDQAKELLTRIARGSPSDSTTAAIGEHIGSYLIGEKRMVADGKVTDDFKRAFDELRSANPNAANFVHNLIAAQAERFGLTEEAVRSILGEKAIEQMARQQRAMFDAGPTYEERKEYGELVNKIRNALEEDLKAPPKNALSADERRAVLGLINGYEEDPDKLKSAFAKLNLHENVKNRYRELYAKNFPIEDIGAIRGLMTNKDLLNNLEDAIHEFTMDNLREKGIIKEGGDGTLVIDKKGFKKLINEYYYRALKDVHSDTSKLYNQAMDPYQYGYYFGGLRGLIGRLCTSLRSSYFGDKKVTAEMEKFLDDIKGRFQSSILTYAEIFHNLPLYARDAASFEKWPEFLGYLFPSELAEVFNPDDKLMEITRHEVTMWLRKKIVLYGNKIPPDLLSGNYSREGARYGFKYREEIRDILKKRMEQLGMKVDTWEYERAMTYAVGIGLSNLVDIEVISSADPNVGDFKGIHPLAAALSAKHNWQLGRGYPFVGRLPHLLAMDVTLFPEQRGLVSRLLFKKKWVPKQFADMVEKQVIKYGDKVFNELFDRGGKYQELLNMINIAASLNSRHGWRVEPLRKAVKNFLETEKGLKFSDASRFWTAKEWAQFFDVSLREYGNSSLWWMIATERLPTEMKRLLNSQLGLDRGEEEYQLYDSGGTGLGKKGLEKLDFEMDGRKVKLSYLEIKNLRLYQLRGESFYHYLKRNPGDFFLLLSQLVPEIADGKGDVFKTETQLRKEGISRLDIERIVARQSQIRKRWGDEQFAILKKVSDWVINNTGKDKKFKDVKQFISCLVEESGTAFEKMMQENQEFEKNNQKDRMRLYITEDDFTDKEIAKLIFGEQGLFSIIKQSDFGDFNRMGERGFFFKMGEAWTLKQADVNPFASDLNHFKLYEHLGEVGEDVAKRYLGDAATVKKIIEGVAHLEESLLKASSSGDLKEIYELHEKMFAALKGTMGSEYAYRANNILASIVTQFFWEHSLARQSFLRFPFDIPIRLLIGKNISLSKIVTGNRQAFSMDENAARSYFRKLAFELKVLPHEGAWSHDWLERAFDAKTDTFIFGDVMPTVFYFLAIYLIWTYMKKALEEAEGKKK